MTRSLTAILLVAASLSITAPQTVEAQLGGLIKKKVKEAIKPPEKPAPASPAPADQPPASSSKETDKLPRVKEGAGALVITPEMLARVTRGLDAELALMADFQKVLAKYPTREEYEKCKSNAMLTPEGQKIMARYMDIPQNTPPEKARDMMMKAGADAEAYQKTKCPNDPSDWTEGKRSERVEQIHLKAASMARARPVSSTSGNPKAGKPMLLYDVDPYEALPDTATDTVLVIGEGGLDQNDYSAVIERIVKYCQLKKVMDMSPGKGTVRAPGSGKDIYWIFEDRELETLKTVNCDSFMKKYASLIRLYG
ncbi:MAG TPA: hypothetical protein VKO87_06890 [Gemmatimonadaceae bacterium]|nr:hypothetical protein [Gemmatimonadaceae bacterium]